MEIIKKINMKMINIQDYAEKMSRRYFCIDLFERIMNFIKYNYSLKYCSMKLNCSNNLVNSKFSIFI